MQFIISKSMKVGVDTYSYHRLLGWPRPGEEPVRLPLTDGGPAALAQPRALGCDVVSLQTCFLGSALALDVHALREACRPMDVVLAWGHPEGLAFGRDARAQEELDDWIAVASALGADLMRIVVGGPALRGSEPVEDQLARTAPLVRRAAERGAALGVRLAIENHADLDSRELLALIERADTADVGVCFDTANAARVGEDPVEAAERLMPFVSMVHLKDVEPAERVRDPVAGPCSVPYGEGVVPIAEILAVLETPISGGCPVCVEIGQVGPGVDERQLVDLGVRWLRALPASA